MNGEPHGLAIHVWRVHKALVEDYIGSMELPGTSPPPPRVPPPTLIPPALVSQIEPAWNATLSVLGII